ncbi:DUF2971 domain-containing protein [Parasedimentitalea huanghaiensis]|uniref:Uncharacterized protein n=1 Tax=Parasedimentitalea huanghaiensis TaxID=2682100 RepID=A0A6L6WKM7_9RHOB|nr:DUF2971 domain-containing protein [Zongyanglinia huanghaiensis]MVO18224.1 hypothetical protein [Zongyanglinia huanghaiensis]
MFFHTAIGTKHPDFAEEQEWRLYYRPTERESPVMLSRIEVLAGVPQTIFTLPLKTNLKTAFTTPMSRAFWIVSSLDPQNILM